MIVFFLGGEWGGGEVFGSLGRAGRAAFVRKVLIYSE